MLRPRRHPLPILLLAAILGTAVSAVAVCVANSSGLAAAECAAWQAGFDAMGNGTGWISCGGARANPCGCVEGVRGIYCKDGSIKVVKLGSNNMQGSIPEAFIALTKLGQLRLSSNNFIPGPLPASWASMTALFELAVGNAHRSGTLPASWSALTALKTLVSPVAPPPPASAQAPAARPASIMFVARRLPPTPSLVVCRAASAPE
jgi:hypothetical protein